MKYTPHEYQNFATEHLMTHPEAGLIIDMGLGKTVMTLTAIHQLMFDELEINKVLVIAPKKVAEDTWLTEIRKWDHLTHLRLSRVLGTERERKEALLAKADIYIINRENVPWLVGHYGTGFPFDMVVIDELSSFKSAKSQRFKALRMVRPKVKRVVGLTGTPAPNGLLDLWSQLYLLDQGERLGDTLTGFRAKFFRKNEYSPFAKYEVIQEKGDDLIGADYYEKRIYEKISDICISMKAKDYLELPDRIDRIKEVHLSREMKVKYDKFERDLILSIEDVDDISAVNAAVLTNKLLQFSNGAVYDDEKNWHEIHREKLEALEEDMEAANGQPVLVFYSYKHDLERIQKYFRSYKPVVLKGSAEIKDWNDKKIQMLLAHPASAGHGLNLQAGGHLIEWFGLQWGLELYQQAVARLDRQGQVKPVINTRIITRGTMDEDVLEALANKATVQNALLNAVKARIKKYKN